MVGHTTGNRRGPRLKHQYVAAEIREAIMTGAYADGTLLPGENVLAEKFSVSRSTIRGALEGLAADNLIATRTGIGSFVTFDGASLDQVPGWGLALAMGGVDADVEIIRAETVVDPELAAEVTSASLEFLALDRIRRLSDGRAISLERSRVPATGVLARVPEDGLVDDSLTATMNAAGVVAASGDQWIAVAPLNAEDARLLGRERGTVFLTAVRLARDADGGFVEKVVSWLDPERFRLHVRFGG
ncbi:GntR family transcriptional regulator [Mycolicibacterium sediminis]|uniref:GntR family transcriptional regulator n=1 Tax=Mycolicibacterium sediminis TaxID=1286180 RepID=A0A7I7QXV5_9MYCO|nr:GntR family transcriptional regulator [Mycolicibacterium sediminis]BBY30680.1 GntR family transcriptional regulator [Mycolicibacterium sediminis]